VFACVHTCVSEQSILGGGAGVFACVHTCVSASDPGRPALSIPGRQSSMGPCHCCLVIVPLSVPLLRAVPLLRVRPPRPHLTFASTISICLMRSLQSADTCGGSGSYTPLQQGCVRACVRACVRVCVCVRVQAYVYARVFMLACVRVCSEVGNKGQVRAHCGHASHRQRGWMMPGESTISICLMRSLQSADTCGDSGTLSTASTPQMLHIYTKHAHKQAPPPPTPHIYKACSHYTHLPSSPPSTHTRAHPHLWMALLSATWLGPLNGSWPVSASYRMTPMAQMSTDGPSYSLPGG